MENSYQSVGWIGSKGLHVSNILLIDVEGRRQEFNYSHHPIGLMYLAAFVESLFPHIKVHILHTAVHEDPETVLSVLLSELCPEIVGFRSCSAYLAHYKELAKRVRAQEPMALLIGGGPHNSADFDGVLRSGLVDLVVIGEGEFSFADVIREVEAGVSLPTNVVGTAVLKDGRIVRNLACPLIEDLDILPFPDYSKINIDDYIGFGNQSSVPLDRYTLVQTARGCPYACSFCHNQFGRRVRRHSPEYICNFMQTHYDRGIRDFIVIDDIFNVPKKAAKVMLRAFIARFSDIRLYFANGLRVDQVDDELVQLLEEAGTVMVAAAVETASVRLQKQIGKKLMLERAEKAIHMLEERFITRVFFILGFPSETMEEAKGTIEWSARFLSALPALFVLRIYPKTSVFNELNPNKEQQEGISSQAALLFDARFDSQHYFYGDHFPPETVPLNSTQIHLLRLHWARKVLLNPKRIRGFNRILRRYLDEERVRSFYQAVYQYIAPNTSQADFEKLFLLDSDAAPAHEAGVTPQSILQPASQSRDSTTGDATNAGAVALAGIHAELAGEDRAEQAADSRGVGGPGLTDGG